MRVKTSGIYKIQSISYPEKYYVGSAVDIKGRKAVHISDLKYGVHCNTKLQHHINKYGIEDLIFSILEECNRSALISMEQYYIDTLNPWFNICKTAGNTIGQQPLLGRHHSEETKLKMSQCQLGNTKGRGNLGRELSIEHIQHSRDGQIRRNGKKYHGIYLTHYTVKGRVYTYFRAQIQVNNKKMGIGYFSTEEEAARAYDKKAKELLGKFANLNFKD